jgi:hypothetical protein
MIQPLKKTMLIDSSMTALITRVDQLNMEIYGRVPLEEEFMPLIEINSKTPAAWQKALKKINDHNANINAQILSSKLIVELIEISYPALSTLFER